MRIQAACARSVLAAAALAVAPVATLPLFGQAPAAVQSSVGTVKTVGGGTLSLSTDKGDTVSFTLPANVRVLRLTPGSTDLKSAEPASIADITTGDRALVSGRAADGGSTTALRVILMKSGAIAQNNASRQQDWQRRGSGGLVTAVDPAAHTLTITSGTRKETITTTSSTVFRRYAPGSVKFEDASLSKLDAIQPGDQVRVRGDRSADGTSIAADEVVSGSFRNVAGLVTRIDTAGNTLTLNDLATKKPITIALSSDSDLRNLPPEMAARFAARAHGAGAGAAGGRPTGAAGAAPRSTPNTTSTTESASGEAPAGQGGPGSHAGGRSGDLSQIITRLPKTTLADLKPGEAVMVVASGDGGEGKNPTAITLLSGVEPLLAASPQGGANSFSISPWSLGGGEGGGEGAGPQ